MIFEQAQKAIQHYQTDPVGFCIDLMGVNLQHWQSVALRTLADPDTLRFAIRACYGPGKTCVAALSVLWFLCCFYPARVLCTAPSGHQLYEKLWAEIKTWMVASKNINLEKFFEWQAHKVVLREAPQLHFASARVSKISETIAGPQAFALQGTHAPHVMFLIEESSGVHDAVAKVAEGVLATEAITKKLFCIGNPNQPSGWFYKIWGEDSDLWRKMRVGYDKSKQVSDAWAQQLIEKYGWDSAYVRVVVRGEFPKSVTDGLITLDEWAATIGKEKREEIEKENPLAQTTLGVDVSGEGSNKSIITHAKGKVAYGNRKDLDGLTNDELAEEVFFEIKRKSATIVVIDADGIGAILCQSVERLLAEHRMHQVVVIRWHGNSPARQSGIYGNARAELGAELRFAAQRRELSLFQDRDLEAQATMIKTYRNRGLEWLEDKRQFSARLAKTTSSKSPDELDSAMYSLVPALLDISHAAVAPKAPKTSRRQHLRRKVIA